jgi:hypothetical protein
MILEHWLYSSGSWSMRGTGKLAVVIVYRSSCVVLNSIYVVKERGPCVLLEHWLCCCASLFVRGSYQWLCFNGTLSIRDT